MVRRSVTNSRGGRRSSSNSKNEDEIVIKTSNNEDEMITDTGEEDMDGESDDEEELLMEDGEAMDEDEAENSEDSDNEEENENGADQKAAKDEEDAEENKEEGKENTNRSSAARRALLRAVEGANSIRPLVKLLFYPESSGNTSSNSDACALSNMTAKEQREIVVECVKDGSKFHKGLVRRLFAALSDILSSAVLDEELYIPASAYEDEDDDNEEEEGHPDSNREKEVIPDETSTEALLFMRGCAMLVNAHMDGLIHRQRNRGRGSSISTASTKKPQKSVVDEVFTVASLLHDALFTLQSCGAQGQKTQAAISTLCQSWWHNNLLHKELLVTQLVPLLVVKTLDGAATQQDIKRLHAMRDALDLLDFEDESIEYLRSLLLRALSSPLYLRHNDGKEFIAHLFTLHPSFVPHLHQAIRVQIPDARRTFLQAYGNIYLRAWRKAAAAVSAAFYNGSTVESETSSDNAIQTSIEQNALQDLMYASLHVSTKSMSKSICLVLQPLHAARKVPEIDSLLYRMYTPILWRALSAANPLVRLNAISVLVDTFPLHNPNNADKNHDTTQESVQKTYQALISLLTDVDPTVRASASDASARILAAFWDYLPTNNIRSLLDHIITQHASDKSSSTVRASAVTSITLLLDAPQSHAVLRSLLPSIGNLIHDNIERVRLAVVKMLLRVKKIKGIKFYHVVPVDHLLARLAAERSNSTASKKKTTTQEQTLHGSTVAIALTDLLLNSYFPRGEHVTGADQIRRTLTFLTNHPDAAAVFYANISKHLSVNSVCKLAAMLLKCLCASVEADGQQNVSQNSIASTIVSHSTKRKTRTKKRKSSNILSESSISNIQQEDDPQQKFKDMSSSSSSLKDDGKEGDALSASNTSLMASIAETICSLWESLDSSIAKTENQSCYKFLLDAFSGAVLTDVHSHFEQKANAHFNENDSNNNSYIDDEHNIIRRDCHRICAALLRCAGKMPHSAVQGLASSLSRKLSDLCKKDESIRKVVNVSPHIALLCLWGKTEDVASSLAHVISQAFEQNGNYCSIGSLPFDDDNFANKNNSDKLGRNSNSFERKQTRRRSARILSSSDRPSSPLAMPELTPDVALRVIGCILSGPDPSCVAARDSILASKTACGVIGVALEKAMDFAEYVLKPSTYRGDFAVEESEISLVLNACESYGRLALHKEAMKAGPIHLNFQARTLLSWITETLVPSLSTITNNAPTEQEHHQEKCSSPFAISMSCSPIPMDGSRRSSSMDKTPSKLADTSFNSGLSEIDRRRSSSISFGSQDSEAPMYVKAGVISLLKSALCIFSEWLAVGGVDGNEIDSHIAKWCPILFFEDMDVDISPRRELFPAFCRLVIQLARSKSSINVLRNILIKCDQIETGSDEEASFKKSIASILTFGRGPDQAAQAKRVTLVIMDAAKSLVEEAKSDNEESTLEIPTSFEDLFPGKNGCMAIAISSVISSSCGSLALLRLLEDELGQDADCNSKEHRTLQTYCLYLLAEKWQKVYASDIRRIIHKIGTNHAPNESKIQTMINEMMEATA